MTNRKTYRAVVATTPGKPELFKRLITEQGHSQVRNQIEACSFFHSDCAIDEVYAAGIFPRMPGYEVVGRIDAIGACIHPRHPRGLSHASANAH